jgi:hypothetical protein
MARRPSTLGTSRNSISIMTSIESEKVKIAKSIEEVFAFLANANNHQKLMPDSVYNWSSTEDECKFTIQNMAKLELKITERVSPSKIAIIPSAKAPFDLRIEWFLEGDASSCTAQMIIHADLNPFIKMMAVGPLNKLVNYQASTLATI